MKRLFFILLLIGCVTPVTAQRWTVWYGVNLSNELKNGPLKQWHFANAGVDYAIPVSQWDFTVGAGLNTKGGELRVNYAQLEGNVGYRFLDTPSGFALSALAGPYCGIRVSDNRKDWVPLLPELNPLLFGWQAGVKFQFKPIAIKVGYEQALTGYYDASVSSQIVKGNGDPSFPTTKPHSVFVRIGYTF